MAGRLMRKSRLTKNLPTVTKKYQKTNWLFDSP